jgi:hypothetical protein
LYIFVISVADDDDMIISSMSMRSGKGRRYLLVVVEQLDLCGR